MTKLTIKTEQLQKIGQLVTVRNDNSYEFLGYSLDLQTGDFCDLLEQDSPLTEWSCRIITTLLVHYSSARNIPQNGKLIKFRDLPGGCVYELAFIERAINPVANAFGENPVELVDAAKLLGGKILSYGDFSVEIPALEGIPIAFVFWLSEEFPVSVSVFFDGSASYFLDTESLAVLGELVASRLLEARLVLKENVK